MADNTQLNSGSGGDSIVTEDTFTDSGTGVSGQKLPVSKIRLGANGVDGGDVTATNPMPVGLSLSVDGVQTASIKYGSLPVGDSDVLQELKLHTKILTAIDYKLALLTGSWPVNVEE